MPRTSPWDFGVPPDGSERIKEPFFDDLFPDYDTEPVMAYANDPDFVA